MIPAMFTREITALGLSLACALTLAPAGLAQLEVGAKAPKFDIADGRSTGIDSFEDLRGKVVLIDFFFTT